MNLGVACPTDVCPVFCFASSAVLVKCQEQYVKVCSRQDVKCELSVWLKIGRLLARAGLGSGIRRIEKQDETAVLTGFWTTTPQVHSTIVKHDKGE